MFNQKREIQFEAYRTAHETLCNNPDILIALENYFSDYIYQLLQNNFDSIKADYDEASYLFPFWQNYPPDERGRQPRGDQYPWIEVGEHALGDKLPRLLENDFRIRDIGIPTGPDKRYVLSSNKISELTEGLTDSVWLFIDIKSAGPRDDFEHTVMSHNQIAGDGIWEELQAGVKNSVMTATGKYTSHDFHCSIPPLYVLSDSTIVPVILMALKPVYGMNTLDDDEEDGGQPLKKITVVTIPNGLLLERGPKYLEQYPSLLFPGKDDKGKNPLKVRSRVSFEHLKAIHEWRVREVSGN